MTLDEIWRVKEYRNRTGCSLIEAKRAVEDGFDLAPPRPAPPLAELKLDGRTLYVLGPDRTNLWWASVQSTRIPEAEQEQIASHLFAASRASIPPPFASEPPNAPVTPGAGTPAKSAVSSAAGAGTAPGGDLPEAVEEAIRMHSVRCEERGILTDSGREDQAEEWKAIRERDAASAALRSAILSALASERSRAEAAERRATSAENRLSDLPARTATIERLEKELAAAHARAERMRERAYADAEDVLQRFLSKQDHRSMSAYDALDKCIAEIRARALASEGPKP